MRNSSSFAADLHLIEAEYLAYTNRTPDKKAALEALAAAPGFRLWWSGVAAEFDAGFADRVERALGLPQ